MGFTKLFATALLFSRVHASYREDIEHRASRSTWLRDFQMTGNSQDGGGSDDSSSSDDSPPDPLIINGNFADFERFVDQFGEERPVEMKRLPVPELYERKFDSAKKMKDPRFEEALGILHGTKNPFLSSHFRVGDYTLETAYKEDKAEQDPRSFWDNRPSGNCIVCKRPLTPRFYIPMEIGIKRGYLIKTNGGKHIEINFGDGDPPRVCKDFLYKLRKAVICANCASKKDSEDRVIFPNVSFHYINEEALFAYKRQKLKLRHIPRLMFMLSTLVPGEHCPMPLKSYQEVEEKVPSLISSCKHHYNKGRTMVKLLLWREKEVVDRIRMLGHSDADLQEHSRLILEEMLAFEASCVEIERYVKSSEDMLLFVKRICNGLETSGHN